MGITADLKPVISGFSVITAAIADMIAATVNWMTEIRMGSPRLAKWSQQRI
jgi:hypothetical protein